MALIRVLVYSRFKEVKMTTFATIADAWIASREHCIGSLGRINFWVDQFGDKPIDAITE